MSLIHKFTATPGNTSTKFRLEKPVQHLYIRRVGAFSLFFLGLLAGLPETISAEITHPVRQRVRMADEIPHSHVAYWGQHGRSSIVENAPAALREDTVGGKVGDDSLAGDGYDITTKYYINDLGPFDLEANDHFFITLDNCFVGCTYEVYAPEQQVDPKEGQRYFSYEGGVILPTDRERTLNVVGCQAIILPNRPDLIKRVVLRNMLGKELELDMFELRAIQTEANPDTNELNYLSPDPGQRSSLTQNSSEADLLLVVFQSLSAGSYGMQAIESIQLDTSMEEQMKYTLVKVLDRVG